MPTYKGVEYKIEIHPEKGYFRWAAIFPKGNTFVSKSLLLDTADKAEEEAKRTAERAVDDSAWHNR